MSVLGINKRSNNILAELNPLYNNTTNFPSLEEMFTLGGISGNNLTGLNGILTITSSTGWITPGTTPIGEFRRNTGGTVTLSGTLAFGTKSIIIIAVGTSLNINVVRIGNATNGPVIAVGDAPPNSKLDASNVASPPDLTGFGSVAVANVFNLERGVGENILYAYDGTTVTSAAGVIVGNLRGNWPAFTTGSGNAAVVSTAPTSIAGIFLLGFNNFPYDISISDAIVWMGNPSHKGKLYPGFSGRS